MTVKQISHIQKGAIAVIYESRKNEKGIITKLAKDYCTSTRTIGRILEEKGLATPIPHLKGQAHLTLKMLKDFGITDPQGNIDLARLQRILQEAKEMREFETQAAA